MPEKEVFRFPANATPNRVTVEGYNTYYGNQGESFHGHSVRGPDGILYARTREGRTLK